MVTVPVIDAHHHLWDLTHNHYPWLEKRPLDPSVAGDIAPIAKDYLLADYLADIRRQNVVKSVHIECGWNPSDPVGESRWLQGVADQYGFPHAIVGHASLAQPGVERILAGHCEFANVRGIRHIVNWHPDPVKTYVDRNDLLTDEHWRAGFALLRKYGLSFDLQLYPSQMPDGARLAHDFPDTQIILNHTGMPVDRDAEAIGLWRRGMRQLAAAPNVAVKISGLGMVDWHWTVDSIRPFVLETIELFGVGRCLFASNFPVDKLYSDYDTLYGAFREITAGFSEADCRSLFHDNAARVYRI